MKFTIIFILCHKTLWLHCLQYWYCLFMILMLPSPKLKLKPNGIHPDMFKDTRKMQGKHQPSTSYLF